MLSAADWTENTVQRFQNLLRTFDDTYHSQECWSDV